MSFRVQITWKPRGKSRQLENDSLTTTFHELKLIRLDKNSIRILKPIRLSYYTACFSSISWLNFATSGPGLGMVRLQGLLNLQRSFQSFKFKPDWHRNIFYQWLSLSMIISLLVLSIFELLFNVRVLFSFNLHVLIQTFLSYSHDIFETSQSLLDFISTLSSLFLLSSKVH